MTFFPDSGGLEALMAILVIVCLASAMICSSIAFRNGRSTGGFFLVGLLLGLTGIIITLVVVLAARRPRSTPASWYLDPWGHTTYRWWDGTRWTGFTAPSTY